ncbi:DUF3566 domain-containing protein [Kribbella sp. VKM Ac-2566]|uniref:DUF3566 domain-containing protein n=1 Tax=Kribbella sp. VKM Ac-2566 TaxID=2512218 RepID=UPI001062A5CA|nr:DUF3566 domain-containing protein [Kribbella sp. VKM Ac-2566]TDX08740.1 transmembrane protein DUF3566 [Kribbella sp. VKM Ac-2566]
MTNRARPTWPEGAADSSKSQRTAQDGKPSAAPANPASNGRSNGVPGAGGQRTGTPNGQRPSEYRPQARPGTPGVAPVRPQQPAPSTPGRPEPWSPPSTTTPAAGTPSYEGNEAKTESFGDRMNSARQAVLDKAAAVKSDKAERAEAKQERHAQKDAKASGRPQTRKARLRMSRIDPWSVMKTAFLLAIAFGIVTWVAVFIVWSAIGAAGVFDNINSTVQEVLGTPAGEPFRVENYVNTGKVMGFTTLLACADVLIITALATLGSFLYNIAATLLGGLEVTLASED